MIFAIINRIKKMRYLRIYSKGFMLATMLLFTSACNKSDHPVAENKSAPVVVKGVSIQTVGAVSTSETVDVSGVVRARTSAIVSTRVPGVINVLRVREGDRVKKGQLLMQIDAQENQANAQVAAAGIDDARRGVDEALSRKRLADTTFERYKNLFNSQVVSRQEFDSKQTEKELAEQGVARAEARLKQALESSRAAGAMADYTKIVSPISGIITAKQADLGATVFPAQPLLTVEDEGSYQLELAVPESMVAKVHSGSTASIHFDATGDSFVAKIAEIVPSADPLSRTYTAKINLNKKGLSSGMYGRASLDTGGVIKGLMVPKQAIFERGALTSVWVVDNGNIARMRLVKTGRNIQGKVEILSGLSDGERIVINGVEKVSDGAKVE